MSQERYNPQDIEHKWQRRWDDEHAFDCDHDAGKPKY